MRCLLFFFLVFLLLTFSSCKFIKRNIFFKESALKAMMLKHKQDSVRVSDSLRFIQEEQISLENSRLDSARKEDENRKMQNSRLKYKIIVGSFTNSQNARDLSESYKSRGFNSDIINANDDSVEYVSAEAYDNQKQAMERLSVFKTTIEPKAWLYVVK